MRLLSLLPLLSPGLVYGDVGVSLRAGIKPVKPELDFPWPANLRKGLTRAEYVQIFLGVADGFGLKLVEACVQDSLRFEEDVVIALKDFEQKDADGVKDG